MSSPRKRFRKRGSASPEGSALSGSLRNARNLIQSGKTSEGLALLDQLSKANRNPSRRAKIALQIGVSEGNLSRHGEAATAFARAGQLARQAGDTTIALQAGIAEVRALLRSLQTDQAKNVAALILQDLGKAQQDFDTLADLSPDQLAAKGAVTLPARPPRATVALTSIAAAFVESGLTAEARIYLERAIILSPNGASRARQMLAKLSLAADEPEAAERYARESLQMGRFQVKTIPAWQLYLDARARQNKSPILEPELFEGLLTHAKGRSLSASLLSIVRVLRGHSDETWKSIATSALSNPRKGDRVILTEIEKILHADAKLTLSEPSEVIAARSLKLFKANDVSAFEQVAHAKSYVRHTLVSGRSPDLSALTRIAGNRFGETHVIAIRHTAALAAMLAQRHDLAREWLGTLISDTPTGSEAWGKAMWALARMESLFEDRLSEAAFWYLELAANEQTPPRFRIQAMLRGFNFIRDLNDSVNISDLAETILRIIEGIDDYRVLLDTARQLSLVESSLTRVKNEAQRRGVKYAEEAMKKAQPSLELEILEYYNRRLYWDLHATKDIVKKWSEIDTIQIENFRRMKSSRWYYYLSVVFKSLVEEEKILEATNLAENIINREDIAIEGYTIIGVEYAIFLLQRDKPKSFEFLRWISRENPTHRSVSIAHYWLAIEALKEGNIDLAKHHSNALRKCLSPIPSTLDEWEQDMAAQIIIFDGDFNLITRASSVHYTTDFYLKIKAKLEYHITNL